MNNNIDKDLPVLSRRALTLALASIPLLQTTTVFAQNSAVLPLHTPGLDHLDIIVPDVEASAKFYMGLFKTNLHAQPFQGAQRYFVLLGQLNDKREVGYIAIGDSRGRGTYIGHFCTSVTEYRRDSKEIFAAMTEQYAAAGFGEFAGSTGFGGIFADPDGIEIQFLPAPDTLVTAAVPSELVLWQQGMVVPKALDHVLLSVSDLERAVAYYTILYGNISRRDKATGRVHFEFPTTSIILEQSAYQYGDTPKIAHFAVRTEAFDKQKVTAGLTALGAKILPSEDEASVLRFTDLDGIIVELTMA